MSELKIFFRKLDYKFQCSLWPLQTNLQMGISKKDKEKMERESSSCYSDSHNWRLKMQNKMQSSVNVCSLLNVFRPANVMTTLRVAQEYCCM